MSQSWSHTDASKVSEDIDVLFIFKVTDIYMDDLNVARKLLI